VQLLNQLVELDDILYEGDAIEDDLDIIFSNPIPSTIPKWRRWVQRNALITFELIVGFR
jgi:hypothetical protein